jgi:hypothetical protein
METPTTPDPETPPTPPDYIYPDRPDIPAELRGRTAREVAEMFQALAGSGYAAPRPTAPPPSPAPPASPSNGNGTYATTAQVQHLAEQQARLNYDIVRQRHGEVLRRWESEVAEVLSRIPAHLRDVEAIENAVTFVKGRHVEEIAAERARVAHVPDLGAGFAMRSMGRTNGGGYALPKPENPAEQAIASWQQRAAAAGITDREVREMCAQNDMTEDEFWRQFGSGLITDAVADRGASNGKRRG